MLKSSLSIWHDAVLGHQIDGRLKILSIFVAFLEDMNFIESVNTFSILSSRESYDRYNMRIHLTPGQILLRLENKTFLIKSMNLAKKKLLGVTLTFLQQKKTREIIFLNNFPPTLEFQTGKQGLINSQGKVLITYLCSLQ